VTNLLNGVDLDGLCHEAQSIEFPKIVPGRVVHIDADFLAYQVSYEKEDEPKTLEEMQHNCEMAADTIRQLAGAEEYTLHLTPKDSDKGGRFDIALLKEYQGNRQDKPKPRYLHLIRDWMHSDMGAILHMDKEADDGMAIAQWASRDKQDLSVIATKDKDLSMVPGLHLDWDTGDIYRVFGFGTLFMHEYETHSGNAAKKLKGDGPKWFWAQMLMGDSADNISGLPCVHPKVVMKVKPTAAVTKALENPDSAKSKAVFDAIKPKACGPAMALDILGNVKDNATAFKVVRQLYQLASEVEPFKHWKTGKPVSWQEAFISEAKLLWMRRNNTANDVLNWMKEECVV
jgi:hypothetical protein